MIDVDGISVDLGEVRVLDDVSLDVQGGEILGLIGPNGSGKTTLIRSIAGLLTPATGQVWIDGTEVSDLARRALSRQVAVVPQNTTLSFGFSVREIIAMGRTPYYGRLNDHDPRGSAIVDEALEQTATEHLADRSITEVSGGERQRVLIARAIAQDTPVMLLDEPTASLDIRHQVDTFDLVRDAVDEGKAAIAAIHDLNLAARYCDRLVLLSNGRTIAHGTPTEVLQSGPIEGAFDTETAVREDLVTGTPSVTPLSGRPKRDRRIVVLGYAESSAPVVRSLCADGYPVQLGIVRTGQLDEELGQALHLETFRAPAAGKFPQGVIEQARAAVQQSDLTVLTDLEIDHLNRSLLDVASAAESLVVVEDRPFEARNHAGEDAYKQYRSLRERGHVITSDRVLSVVSASRTAIEEEVQSGGLTRSG